MQYLFKYCLTLNKFRGIMSIEIKDDEIILSRHGKGGKFKGFKHLFVGYKGIPCIYMYVESTDVLKLKTLGIKLIEPTEMAAVLMGNFEIAYSTRDIMNYYMFRHLNLGVDDNDY